MLAGVLHALWLYGRYRSSTSCRAVIEESPLLRVEPADKQQRLMDFLATPEADEQIGVVLARYGSRAES